MRLLLILFSGLLLAGCGAKTNGPLGLYFISSSRFTSGNRTSVVAADTLATSLYALTDTITDTSNRLTQFTATVTYSPRREPFAYPTQLNLFLNNVPADPEVTYLDTTLTHGDFLYTSMFGARTTAGTERWAFTAKDKSGNTSSRSFVLAVRRTDSLNIYHDYTLKLRVPATTTSARRFIDLKSGLALPAYAVLGKDIPAVAIAKTPLQQLTDVIVLPDGLRLASPDTLGALLKFSDTRWPVGNRRKTRFRLTTLLPAGFTSAQSATDIQNQFTGTGRAYIRTLALDQVYAFQAFRADGTTPVYGLMRVLSVPNGTSSVGLQLQIRVAKQTI
jgi:hypothetical protein